MKATRQYTCTRRINKTGDKIWVVLENDKLFYRIFKTQTAAVTYFKQLKTPAQMLVQQSTGDKFSKMVFTIEEMARRDLKAASKTIELKLVKDSDKFFNEKELKDKYEKSLKKEDKPKPTKKKTAKPAEKKVAKPVEKEPVKPAKKKPAKPAEKKVAKPVEKKVTKPVEKEVVKKPAKKKPAKKKITKPVPAPTPTPKPIEEIKEEQKPIIHNPISHEIMNTKNISQDDTSTRDMNLNKEVNNSLTKHEESKKSLNLISELAKLDEIKVGVNQEDTLNLSIIDEILKRKSMVENLWDEDQDNSGKLDLKNSVENTIYVKEEVEKPIIVNAKKIDFNEQSQKTTSTIETIIDQRTNETNVKSVDYGRIKEYYPMPKTDVQDMNKESSENSEELASSSKNKRSDDHKQKTSGGNFRFWTITILLSLLIMVGVALIVLFFFPETWK
ncbi:MAG: hypothetical protein ACRCXE_01535 [Metamycoplasmataceae bacterium]